MATQRFVEVRVGLFVLVCLLLGAGLIWQFGKLGPSTEKQYPVVVMFDNVGGLIGDANVMYAGVGIGKVREIRLREDGGRLRARVTLGIREGVVIRKDAKFVINQSGLLGDRYVDVIPGTVTAEPLQPGAVLNGSPSVDLTEAIRSVLDVLQEAAGTIERVKLLVGRVDASVQRVDEIVLSTQSLAHVSQTLANMDAATSNTVALTGSLHDLVEENRQTVTNTLGKLALAADNVNMAVKRVDDLVHGSEGDVHAALKNLAASTEKLNTILERLEKGEGTAGKLLVDPTLHDEVVRLVQNLRQHGLLYKEGTPRPVETPRRGKTPVPARPAEVETTTP